MTGDQLTDALAVRVMEWRLAPGRYLKSGRQWAPCWHFQPLYRLEHALQLLEKAADTYSLKRNAEGIFEARVSVGGCAGNALGTSPATAITVAIARAVGIDAPNELLEERR